MGLNHITDQRRSKWTRESTQSSLSNTWLGESLVHSTSGMFWALLSQEGARSRLLGLPADPASVLAAVSSLCLARYLPLTVSNRQLLTFICGMLTVKERCLNAVFITFLEPLLPSDIFL